MLDHITFQVKNLKKSKEFYEKVLAVLGYKQNLTNEKQTFYGFGLGDDPIIEIVQSTKSRPSHKKIHIAFKAKSKDQVKEFHKVAIKNGAKDNGKPGMRKDYTPTYYAAFVKDPDGNNLEVCIY